MRIQQLVLKNFRCFEELDLTLHKQVTLLVGVNGAGKTAVLEAAAIALGAWLGGTSDARKEDRTFFPGDARLVRQEGAGLATVNSIWPVRIEARGKIERFAANAHKPLALGWARELRSETGRTTTGEAGVLRTTAQVMEMVAAKDPTHPLPLMAYYGTGRLWVQRRARGLGAEKAHRSRMDGYAGCLGFASTHWHFEHWMATRELDRLQRLAAAQSARVPLESVESPHLQAVQDAVCACLEGARRFFYSINHDELRVEFDDGQIIPYHYLSDGQRGLIMLAADIAWRAAQLNPDLGTRAPAETKGVVLIDEVELHLHPRWQRQVIHHLTKTFPQIQFVLTTHSPQVVSSARAEWLRLVSPDGNWSRADYTLGRDSNALLRDVFGTTDRPASTWQEIERIERLLGSGELAEARAALDQLSWLVGPDDRLISGLYWELQDLEINGPLEDGEGDA